MTFVDTGAWFALMVPWDPDHAAANRWWATGQRERLLTSDYVVDETLTLMRSRGENRRALILGEEFFEGRIAGVHHLDSGEVLAAWDVFERFSDKEWSFTDCTSRVLMERLGIRRAFAFDKHFQQFGTVEVVPADGAGG